MLVLSSTSALLAVVAAASSLAVCAIAATAAMNGIGTMPRLTPRLAYEALGGGLATEDGKRVPLFRYLGGSEELPPEALAQSSGVQYVELGPSGTHEHLATAQIRRSLDPFLVFDAYRAASGEEVKGGFPAHPHRGILEVRHFHEGGIEHEDGCGNEAVAPPGGGQALFAGRGIAHEERPLIVADADGDEQEAVQTEPIKRVRRSWGPGFRGFQLWINLPRAAKALPPSYTLAESFPVVALTRQASGGPSPPWEWTSHPVMLPELVAAATTTISLLAGTPIPLAANDDDDVPTGPFTALFAAAVAQGKATRGRSLYWDVTLKCSDGPLLLDVPKGQNALLFTHTRHWMGCKAADGDDEEGLRRSTYTQPATGPTTGRLILGGRADPDAAFVPPDTLVVLSEGDHVTVECDAGRRGRGGSKGAEAVTSFLLVSAPQTNEEVVIASGFAMATEEDLRVAVEDLENGRSSHC